MVLEIFFFYNREAYAAVFITFCLDFCGAGDPAAGDDPDLLEDLAAAGLDFPLPGGVGEGTDGVKIPGGGSFLAGVGGSFLAGVGGSFLAGVGGSFLAGVGGSFLAGVRGSFFTLMESTMGCGDGASKS